MTARPPRIGIYVANLAVRPGHEHIVSGHVQVPVQTAALLHQAGHAVEILSSEFAPDAAMPAILPAGIPIRQIPYVDRRRHRQVHLAASGQRRGLLSILRMFWAIRRLCREQQYDVLHLFGGPGTLDMAGIVARLLPACRVVVTLNVGPMSLTATPPRRWLWRAVDAVICSSETSRRHLDTLGRAARLLRHGAIRQFSLPPPGDRPCVLFWREASPLNGGDLVVELFARLAPRHPELDFVLAIRPHPRQPPALQTLPREHPNIRLHQAPYPPGISLEQFLADAVCVVFPFRAFTIHPQMAIIESLAAGAPVVASDVECAAELIEHEVGGLLCAPESVDALAAAVERCITDPQAARRWRDNGRKQLESRWTWSGYIERLLGIYAAES